MDISNKPAGAAPVTDDQELAKVLESMNKDIPSITPPPAPAAPTTDAPKTDDVPAMPTLTPPSTPPAPEVTPPSSEIPMPSFEAPGLSDDGETHAPEAPSLETTTVSEEPQIKLSSTPTFDVTAAPTSTGDSQLDGIKKDVLVELRPLVDKLTLPADEKFDTLLLLIRSTDDKTLIPAAHEAAKSIDDETKRAEALLDIIKEIDYFTNKK